MANEIKLQEGHPVDENLRPLKVGGKTTAIELAQNGNGARITGGLEVSGTGRSIIAEPLVTNNIISTDLTIDDSASITFDSGNASFQLKYNGTKYADMYAGTIIGYTRISNNGTGASDAHISLTGTMAVIQTVSGTNVGVTFVAPPSGNVEILFICTLYTSSTTMGFGLSDNASFNEVHESHTYDNGAYKMDETDINVVTIPFSVTGLTAGTSYTYYIGAEETSGSTSTIYHGRFRSTGRHHPPIIVKAIALPSSITTGE